MTALSATFVNAGKRAREHGNGGQVVDRNSEEPFERRRVYIDRHDVIDARTLRQLRDEARHDRRSTPVAAIGSRVAEVRHDRDDARRVRTPARVCKSKQLDEMIVHRRRGRGEENDLFAANRLLEAHGDFSVGKSLDRRRGKAAAERRAQPPQRANDWLIRRSASLLLWRSTESACQEPWGGIVSVATIVWRLLVEQSPNESALTSRTASNPSLTETAPLVHDPRAPIA